MTTSTYVHLLAPDGGTLPAFVASAEEAFLEYGLAPDIERPTGLSVAAARRWSRTDPATSDGGWRTYIGPSLVSAVDPDGSEQLSYAGVAGATVVGRVLREATAGHPAVAMQSHTCRGGTPVDYTVYRYDAAAETYDPVASGDVTDLR